MTKLAMIGDPVDHTLSPMVHQRVFKELGLSCTCQKVLVKKGELADFLDFALREKIEGFNLTMPHKQDIIPYLSKIDADAACFGAVNTVRILDGKLYGYNTDAEGYLFALLQKGHSFKGKNILLLGAGGAARTLALKAVREGAKSLRILNRTVLPASQIVDEAERLGKTELSFGMLENKNLFDACSACELVINATPLGMQGVPSDFTDFSFLDALPKGTLVSDLIYKPGKTKLLQSAETRGYQTMNGFGMLLYQAILADEIYLGKNLEKAEIYQKIFRDIEKEIFS